MRKNKLIFIYLTILILFLTSLVPSTVFAHKMLVEHVEDGIIYIHYDNGTPAKIATVTLYDEHGNILLEEVANDHGYVYYDGETTVYRIVADDGMGHRASSVKSEENNEESIPSFMKALLGVSILLFVAAFFYYRN